MINIARGRADPPTNACRRHVCRYNLCGEQCALPRLLNLSPSSRSLWNEYGAVVDRPGAQSIVWNGPLRGETLHELWTQHRQEIFGDVPATARFPLVAKLIDARAKLSLQVHPPSRVAKALGGEMKDEIWYVLDAVSDAQIYAGLRSGVTREQFGAALENSTVAELVHRISVKRGDAIFMPSGRLHTMGDGILVAEIQQ